MQRLQLRGAIQALLLSVSRCLFEITRSYTLYGVEQLGSKCRRLPPCFFLSARQTFFLAEGPLVAALAAGRCHSGVAAECLQVSF